MAQRNGKAERNGDKTRNGMAERNRDKRGIGNKINDNIRHVILLYCFIHKIYRFMKLTIWCHKTYRFTEHVVVESDSKMGPHYVTIAKSGKITCNDCPMWKAQKICAHSLAVAEKSCMAASFLNWFKSKRKRSYSS